MNNEYLLSLVVGAGRRATDVITGSTIHHAKHGLNGHNGNDLHNGWGFVGLGWFLVGF